METIITITAILALILFLGRRKLLNKFQQLKPKNRENQPASIPSNSPTKRPIKAPKASPHTVPPPQFPPLIRSNAFGPLTSTPKSVLFHDSPSPENQDQEIPRPRRLFSEPNPKSESSPTKHQD